MKSSVFEDGNAFEGSIFNKEKVFGRIAKVNSKTLFEDKSIFFDVKNKINPKKFGTEVANGFLFVFKGANSPKFCLREFVRSASLKKLKKPVALCISVLLILSMLSFFGNTAIQVAEATPVSFDFGNKSIGTITNYFTTDRDASRFELTQNGILQSITVYFTNEGFNAKTAIYTDSNGAPLMLIAQSNSQEISINGWQTFPVPQSFLTAGHYWLCVVSSSASYGAMSTTSANTHAWKTTSYSEEYTSTFGSPNGYEETVSSIYATCIAEDYTPTPTPTPTPTDLVAEMISKMSQTEIYNTAYTLQNFMTRFYGTSGNFEAGTYLYNRFSEISGLSVEYQSNYRNIVATLPGTDLTSTATYIVGAHYDSTSDNPENFAPGVTDNGVAVAVVLEFARIMSQYTFSHTVKFACWNAEEQWELGSLEYVQVCF